MVESSVIHELLHPRIDLDIVKIHSKAGCSRFAEYFAVAVLVVLVVLVAAVVAVDGRMVIERGFECKDQRTKIQAVVGIVPMGDI